MRVYKREDKGDSSPYWYCFVYKGRRIRRSSGVYNKQDAKDIASAFRTQLCKGEVGIDEPEEKEPVPRFKQAMEDFLEWAKIEYAAHPATARRYKTSSKALFTSAILPLIASTPTTLRSSRPGARSKRNEHPLRGSERAVSLMRKLTSR